VSDAFGLLDLPEPVMLEILDCCSILVVLPAVESDVIDLALIWVDMAFSYSSSSAILPRRVHHLMQNLESWSLVDFLPMDLHVRFVKELCLS
jgi:hypothetical protein